MKNTGKTGNVASTSIDFKEPITLDDLMYVYTAKSSIDKLYEKLRLIYSREIYRENTPYTEWAKKNKVSTRLMPEMKRLGYCDGDNKWMHANPPRKGDAIILQLAVRKSEQAAKERVEERKLEHLSRTGGSER